MSVFSRPAVQTVQVRLLHGKLAPVFLCLLPVIHDGSSRDGGVSLFTKRMASTESSLLAQIGDGLARLANLALP